MFINLDDVGDGSNIHTPETVHDISNNPQLREFLGFPYIVIPRMYDIPGKNRAYQLLIASYDLKSYVDNLDVTRGTFDIVHKDGIESFDASEVYDQCALPHKYVLGCHGCMEISDTTNHCRPKALALKDDGEASDEGAEDIIEWARKKSNRRIAGFEYVSPTMTAAKSFENSVRKLNDHHFELIPNNVYDKHDSAVRAAALMRFKRKTCTTCLLYEGCTKEGKNGKNFYHSRYCTGTFKYDNWDQYIDTVIQGMTTEYTDQQLAFIAYNSGLLSKRYKRRVVYLTLSQQYHDGDKLVAVLRHKRSPYRYKDIKVQGFDAVLGLLGADAKEPPEHLATITKKQKALLYMASAISSSPTHTRNWRSVNYPIAYIDLRWGGDVQLYALCNFEIRNWCTLSMSNPVDFVSYWGVNAITNTTEFNRTR